MTAYSATHVFMASTGPSKSPPARPNLARVPSSTGDGGKDEPRQAVKKAHTFADTSTLARTQSSESTRGPDAFETHADVDNDDDSDGADVIRGSIDLSDLPIELVSLTDR